MTEGKIRISYLDPAKGVQSELQPPDELCRLLATMNCEVHHLVWQFEVKLKFILYELPNTDDGDEAIFHLVIGRPYTRRTFYEHRQLAFVATHKLDVANPVITGGDLIISRDRFSGDLAAKLCGASGTYGVYDYRLLKHRKTITEALRMTTDFAYLDVVRFPVAE